MSQHTYGCNCSISGYFDVSNTLRGAKCWATRNGYSEVYIRFNYGYHVELKATKNEQEKWIDE